MKIQTLQNFLTDAEFTEFATEISGMPAQWGAVSTDWSFPIWKITLSQHSRIAARLVEELNARTQSTFVLADIPHVNMQTCGLDGAFHIDAAQGAFGDVTHALTWYCHPNEWLEVYGGYLLVGENVTDLTAILPVTNMAVLIDASIPHRSLAPFQRAGTLPRVSLTLKLRLED
jgi:hypothetical protein